MIYLPDSHDYPVALTLSQKEWAPLMVTQITLTV